MAEFDLEKAIEMWNEGKTSTQIANHFGVTRHVVIGKITRARIAGRYVRSKPNICTSKPKPNKASSPKPAKGIGFIMKEMPLLEAPIVIRQPRIYELEPNQCKYSVDAVDGEYVFCGKPTNDRPYCDEHYELCHTKPEPKKKNVILLDTKRKFMHYR